MAGSVDLEGGRERGRQLLRRGFLPAPRPVRAFFDEFTWVLPVPHIGIVGMLTLTRWWDFWTS